MILFALLCSLFSTGRSECHDICYKDGCKATRWNPLTMGKTYETTQPKYRSSGCCWWSRGACDQCCNDDDNKHNPLVENRGALTTDELRLAMEMGYLGKSLLDEFGGASVQGKTVVAPPPSGANWMCVKLIDGEDVGLLNKAGRCGWYENADRKMCAVSFRGSATNEDWIKNADTAPDCLDSADTSDNCSGIKTHSGFQDMFEALLVNNNQAEYTAWLKSCSDRGYSINFGGQSLGGALATISAWSLLMNINPVRSWKYDSSKIKIFSTGAPRVLHSTAETCPRLPAGMVYRFVRMEMGDTRTDVVPMIMAGMSHCVGGYGIREDGTTFWNRVQYFPKNGDYSNGFGKINSLFKFNQWHSLTFKGGYLDRLILRVTGSDWRQNGGNICVENGCAAGRMVDWITQNKVAGQVVLIVACVAMMSLFTLRVMKGKVAQESTAEEGGLLTEA